MCLYSDLFQVPEVDAIAAGSFKSLEPPDIKASGYVVHSLEAILWAFHKSSTFKEGCLKVGKHCRVVLECPWYCMHKIFGPRPYTLKPHPQTLKSGDAASKEY